MEEIRLLTTEDIDVRVAQTITNNGEVKVSLLLYKDARVDMKILDELFTPMGWKRTHKLIGDRLYCQVEVWDSEKQEWIVKEDVGTESNTEAEKGQASDSFKRACVNWGIGRELYTAPRITVTLNDKEYARDQNGRIRVFAQFSVKSIGYDKKSRSINSLEIQDRFGNVRYSMTGKPTAAPKKQERSQYSPVSDETYWKIIAAYSKGVPTKTGGDYRETWIQATHAGKEEISKFDHDVENYRLANNQF